MNYHAFVLLTALLTLSMPTTVLAGTPKRYCLQASLKCDFAFNHKGPIPFVSVQDQADVPCTNRIISKEDNENLGQVNTTRRLGEFNTNGIVPEIITGGAPIPIDQLDVKPPLKPTHIKPYSISHNTGSGLGHQVFTGSQLKGLYGKCIRVYFTDYQLLLPDDTVEKNVHDVPRSANKCVVFRIANP